MKPLDSTVVSLDDVAPMLANSRSYWHGWGGGAGDADGDFVWHRTGVPHPLLNGVMRVRNTDLAAALDESRARFDGGPWLWWVGPDSDPGTADALLAAGAVEAMVFPVMAVPLDEIPDRPAPPGLRITRAESPTEVATFVSTYSPPLWVSGNAVDATVERELKRTGQYDAQVRFIGWLDGEPVGTSMLSVSNGVAGIYTVATHGEYRRRGIGAAMSLAALRAGRDLGLRVGTLSATADGTPLYLTLGFKILAHYRLLSF